MHRTFLSAVVVAVALTGCGTTTEDRAISGGLLGAAGGAVVAGATGGSVGTGAVVGGVAGAVVGAVSDPCKLNLGDPFWKKNGGKKAYNRRCGGRR
jgi:hypothetical protein